MNGLIVGTADKTSHLLRMATTPFLLIDDGTIAHAFTARFLRAKVFDLAHHSFNPLRGIDYKQARDLVATLYSASPEGENTLTVRNGKRALMRILMNKPRRLNQLPHDEEVSGMVDDLLLSPVLHRVLCNATNFSFKGNVLVVLNRALIGDIDAFLLAALLIGQHKGQIIIPDFGFYGRPLHMSLIRQKRLLAGVDRLADLPNGFAVNHFHERLPAQALIEDAEVLAKYAGLRPDPTREDNPYNHFIHMATSASVG